MTVSLSPILNGYQSFLSSGLPNNGGLIYTYQAGTTTPAPTYTTSAGTIPNSNPIVLAADGRPPQQIWLVDGTAYKLIILDASSSQISTATYDNISGSASANLPITLALPTGSSLVGGASQLIASVAALRGLSKLSASKNAWLMGFYASGDGGGGPYYYDATDSTSPDNFGLVVVANDGARWKLQRTGIVTARQFGAKGDGTTDDTASLQAFATYLALTGTRGHIPAGRYRITSQITFTNTSYVYGDGWKDVRDANAANVRNWATAQVVGTIIYANYSAATSPAAFYVTGNNTTFRDIEFETDQPIPGAGWVSNATPIAISTYRAPYYEQGGNSVLLENIMIRNFQNGIKMVGTSRGILRGIFGQCFGNALDVTQCGDVLRVEDVHLNWPFYSGDATVNAYMNANAKAVLLGRVDNPIFSNIFVFGGQIGFQLYTDTTATLGGKTERLQGSNIGLDNIAIGFQLYDSCTLALSNVYVYNRAVTGSCGIHSLAALGGGFVPFRLTIANGDFQGSQAEALRFEVPGTIQLSNVVIRDYNNGSVGANGIAVFSGVALQYANVTNDTPSTTALFQANGTGTISGGSGGSSAVSSFNTRTGAITLGSGDITGAGGAALAGAAFTGAVDVGSMMRSTGNTLPAAGVGLEMSYVAGSNSAFAISYDRTNSIYKDLNIGGANITFKSGTAGTNAALFDVNQCFLIGYGTTQGATYKLQVNGAAIFGGAVTMPTQAAGDNTTKGATTAFVAAAITAGVSGVSSFNTRTGAVTLSLADVTSALAFTPYNATNPSGYVAGYDAAKTFRSTASTPPSSGVGVEINWDTSSTAGFINAYDRGASTYKDFNIGANTITFKSGPSGTNAALFDVNQCFIVGYGTTQGSAIKLQVNGTALFGGSVTMPTAAVGSNTTIGATTAFVTAAVAAGGGSSGVSSFNTRTGAVSLSSSDVTGALSFTPYNASNPSGYLSSITSSQVTGALGFTPYNSTNPSGYLTSVSSSQVTSALGYTPYNSSNPSAYVSGYDAPKTHRSTASTTPTSGVGVEFNWDTSSTAGFINAYDRGAGTYQNLNIGGLTLTFKSGSAGSNSASFDANQSLLIGYGATNGSTYKLQVNSQIYATSTTIATSDRRVKMNIEALGDATAIVMALAPVTYDFRPHEIHNFPAGKQIGFIAQDVEAVLSGTEFCTGIVSTNDDGAENLKGLAEAKLIPLLVKAFQELQAKFDAYVSVHP